MSESEKNDIFHIGVCPIGGHIYRKDDTYVMIQPPGPLRKPGEPIPSLPAGSLTWEEVEKAFSIFRQNQAAIRMAVSSASESVSETGLLAIKFQDGSPAVNGLNGFSNEGLIMVLIDRITRLNEELPSGHNLSAIDSLKAALDALNNRNRDRGLVPTSDSVVEDA